MSDYTPEQQKAYDEEMAKLDAEAAKATTEAGNTEATTTPAPVVDESATTTTPAPDSGATDQGDDTSKRLASVEKALADTQRWAHQNAAEVKRLKKEAEDRERAAARPVILDDNPGLEDAIRHVSGAAPAPANQQNNWLETVSGVLPDLEKLLVDSPDFRALAEQKRTEMGASWNDPIAAARELGQLQAQYQSKQATAAAVEAARKDFAVKQKKATAMQMPGGGGSKTVENTSEVDRINNMSQAEFTAMRNKTLGF